MGVTGYPFEQQDTTETQYANLFSELQDPGVIGSALGAAELRATLPGGLVVRIAAGRAYARGFILDNDSDFDVQVGPADTQSRVDRVVARVNPITDTATLEHLRGAPGAGVPRPLVRTFTGAYDVPLYRFTVAGGAVAPTDLVDERQWTSHRVRMWRTSDRELVAPRLGQVGYNLTTRRWEGWAGEWATLADSRDEPSVRVWEGRRTTTNPLTAGQMSALVSMALPAAAPGGFWRITGSLDVTVAGSTTVTLRVVRDGTETVIADVQHTATGNRRPFTWFEVDEHDGGAHTYTLSAQPVAAGVTAHATTTRLLAEWIGPPAP